MALIGPMLPKKSTVVVKNEDEEEPHSGSGATHGGTEHSRPEAEAEYE